MKGGVTLAIISKEKIGNYIVIKHSSGAIEKIVDGAEETSGPPAEAIDEKTDEIIENQLIIMAALADLYEGGLADG